MEKRNKNTEAKIRLLSNAKVNLALDILSAEKSGKFKGYHKIQTIIQEITPQNTAGFKPDIIEIEAEKAKKSTVKTYSNVDSIPNENTISKAAKLILKKCKIPPHAIKITITKNIPIASGLGGGSSNAAAVIKGLNHMFKLNLPVQKMRELAKEISMDTPFFITGGMALAENFGEIITQLPPVKGLAFTITTPKNRPLKNKTKSQYKKINLKKCGKNTSQTTALIHAIKTNDSLSIHSLLHNDFETLLKTPLQKNIHIVGAGPTTFILA
jgi:4-diphosphocytidyl-2-C-methyl-D-erythritol kinase